MTTLATTSIASRRAARALAALCVPAIALSVIALTALPVHADVPEGWSDPEPVDKLDALLFLVGGPLLLFVLISLAVYIPSMIRGERLLPDHGDDDAQWLGGPRQGAAELPAADDAESRAGGASGSW